jgi:hypothetical protein
MRQLSAFPFLPPGHIFYLENLIILQFRCASLGYVGFCRAYVCLCVRGKKERGIFPKSGNVSVVIKYLGGRVV